MTNDSKIVVGSEPRGWDDPETARHYELNAAKETALLACTSLTAALKDLSRAGFVSGAVNFAKSALYKTKDHLAGALPSPNDGVLMAALHTDGPVVDYTPVGQYSDYQLHILVRPPMERSAQPGMYAKHDITGHVTLRLVAMKSGNFRDLNLGGISIDADNRTMVSDFLSLFRVQQQTTTSNLGGTWTRHIINLQDDPGLKAGILTPKDENAISARDKFMLGLRYYKAIQKKENQRGVDKITGQSITGEGYQAFAVKGENCITVIRRVCDVLRVKPPQIEIVLPDTSFYKLQDAAQNLRTFKHAVRATARHLIAIGRPQMADMKAQSILNPPGQPPLKYPKTASPTPT